MQDHFTSDVFKIGSRTLFWWLQPPLLSSNGQHSEINDCLGDIRADY